MAAILIVDDDADSRALLATLLGLEGHEVLEAADGLKAMTLYRARRPDLVLLDIFMPGLDGLETIKALRREFPGSRIIVVSAGWRIGDRDALRVAREVGADVTVRKPIDLHVVRRAVAELLAA